MSDIKEIIGDLIILWDLLKPTVSCQNGGSLGRARNDRYDFQITAFHGLNLRNTAKSFDW
jgi:hypothetical protein